MKRPPKDPPYAYVNRYYGLNIGVGGRIRANGKIGTIVAKPCYDHYVHVKFDDCKFDVPVHPDDIEVLKNTGDIS